MFIVSNINLPFYILNLILILQLYSKIKYNHKDCIISKNE